MLNDDNNNNILPSRIDFHSTRSWLKFTQYSLLHSKSISSRVEQLRKLIKIQIHFQQISISTTDIVWVKNNFNWILHHRTLHENSRQKKTFFRLKWNSSNKKVYILRKCGNVCRGWDFSWRLSRCLMRGSIDSGTRYFLLCMCVQHFHELFFPELMIFLLRKRKRKLYHQLNGACSVCRCSSVAHKLLHLPNFYFLCTWKSNKRIKSFTSLLRHLASSSLAVCLYLYALLYRIPNVNNVLFISLFVTLSSTSNMHKISEFIGTESCHMFLFRVHTFEEFDLNWNYFDLHISIKIH
jgi:hypothetical protein